jgi:Zn-dependent protease with chaperone function
MRFRRHETDARRRTLALLLAFAAVLLGLVFAVNGLVALSYKATLPFTSGFPRGFFETNTALVLLFVLGGTVVESLRLREGGTHVARLAGARPASERGGGAAHRGEARFVDIVAELSLAARTAPPGAWVLAGEDRINAFAAGWAESDRVIVVTRGALERLTREELQGVVAHELGHLQSGDTALNMRLVGLVWGLQLVWGFGRRLSDADAAGRRPASALVGWALLAVGSVGWLAGRVLQASVSRQREFLADASAVRFTRNVAGLGGALRKIAGWPPGRLPPPAVASSLAHLWLVPHGHIEARWLSISMPGLGTWLATHPSIAMRLQRLYGRRVAPLPADPVDDERDPADEAAAASVALAAAAPRNASRTATPVDVAAGSEAPPADRFQRALGDAGARSAEALQRLDRWHSVGEVHAGLLALLIGDDTSPAARAVWHDATAGWRSAAAVRREVLALAPEAHWRALRTLARRAEEQRAAAPPAGIEGGFAALRRAASALPATPSTLARRFALAQGCSPRASRRASGPEHRGRLSDLAAEAVAATHAIAAAMPAGRGSGPPRATAWVEAVAAELGLRATPAAAGPAAWRRLRRLHPMQRPPLLRAWAGQAAAFGGLEGDPGRDAAWAIGAAALWLDCPLPPSVASALGAESGPAVGAVQPRSL